jgi:hypothetical protein
MGGLTLSLAPLLPIAASPQADGAEAVFLSANSQMHFAWFDKNTVIKGAALNISRDAPHSRLGGHEVLR